MAKGTKEIIVRKYKHDTDYYDASTPTAKKKALKTIFQENIDMSYYYDLDDAGYKESEEYNQKAIKKHTDLATLYRTHGEEHDAKKEEEYIKCLQEEAKEKAIQKKLYDLALGGDDVALERLLRRRDGYQYESLEIKILRN